MNIRTTAMAVLLALPGLAQAQAIGKVVLVTGSVTADGHAVSGGTPIVAGQTFVVGSNSYANLKFDDGGRVLLRPDSEFVVEKYAYKGPAVDDKSAAPKGTAAAGTAFFKLLRGGFRAVTGLIRGDRQSYRVTTPAATIGIRGTDYEVQTCTSDCPDRPAKADSGAVEVASSDASGLQLAQAGGGQSGIVVATNEGTVVLTTPRGEFTIDVGQVALAFANGETFRLPAVPDVLLMNTTPSPADCQ